MALLDLRTKLYNEVIYAHVQHKSHFLSFLSIEQKKNWKIVFSGNTIKFF